MTNSAYILLYKCHRSAQKQQMEISLQAVTCYNAHTRDLWGLGPITTCSDVSKGEERIHCIEACRGTIYIVLMYAAVGYILWILVEVGYIV